MPGDIQLSGSPHPGFTVSLGDPRVHIGVLDENVCFWPLRDCKTVGSTRSRALHLIRAAFIIPSMMVYSFLFRIVHSRSVGGK